MMQDCPGPSLTLQLPSLALEEDFYRMVREYRKAGESYDTLLEPLLDHLPTYLRRVDQIARGISLPVGIVQQTLFWLVRDDKSIVAMGRLRHYLTPALEKEGGHIGYTVRPSERRKGYGTLLCALLIQEARNRLGLSRVLITCDSDNIGSARIIQKNGGCFENEVISDWSGKPVSRFWVSTTPTPSTIYRL
ncbi:MAG TPA: GNAT family N-acetyltransferase [Candidatus Hydrogenedentes bacterium]|nr:GNAT family N-acetyltransferase [Candidatus Hydrogenedentota bacterium]HOL76136.1 GNAT family N-acetyltransferase [Candidatus Hydrogenedentota bacterium]HPO84750.1 GNAT family N-acetyltransferase [Candidatus Hydrogenedentota bacterium]